MTQDRGGSRTGFSSNEVRLSPREWLVVAVLLALAAGGMGEVWGRMEGFEPASDYRIPYELSEDYWLFGRHCRSFTEEGRTPVFGDSFVWGQFVHRGETLTQYLNERAGSDRFVNAGLDGAHPLALRGLLREYCGGMKDTDVLLHLNLLWLSSPQADLQAERGMPFNHPKLVPQFLQRIPSYGESFSGRIGVQVGRTVPLLDWVGHLRAVHWGGVGLPQWSLENPYENPLGTISLSPDAYTTDTHPDGEPWTTRGGNQVDLPWVELESSLQWKAFRGLVEDLTAEGNRVVVLMGPLNQHMLRPAALESYRRIREDMERWLTENGVPYQRPSTLPSDLYADLSHPLAEGYARIAEEIWARWDGGGEPTG